MSPTNPALSPAALSHILDALESVSPATVKALSEATGLGQTTISRAAALGISRGALAYKKSTDPASGRSCRAFVPAKGLLLPVLTLTRGYGSVRIVDTELNPVGTAVTELDPTAPPEEAARLLARRCLTLVRGLGSAGSVTAPVLLVGQGLSADILREAVTDTMGVQPLAVMRHAEAVARAVTVRGPSRKAASLLFLSVGEDTHACLLLRDGEGRWVPSSLGENLTPALSRTLRGTAPSTEGIRRGTAVFLTELCRFIRPDRIEIEDPRGAFPDGGVLASLLPSGVEAEVVSNRDGLTVAEEGAALAGRRMLWEKVLGKDIGRK